jgi:hypothetical protein
MGQIQPGNENTKTRWDRKNNTMFRNFVLDKIYAMEDTTNTQADINTKHTSDEDINSITVAPKTKQEPFTVSGTRLKVKNSSLDSSLRYDVGSAKNSNDMIKKYE